MEDSSGSVIQSPEDDEIDAGDTSIQNSRVFSNSSPPLAVNSTTASTSRWLKGDLIGIGELVDVKQVLIDVDDVSEEKSQDIGWSCKCNGSFDRTLQIEIVSDYDTLDSFCDLVRPWNQITIDTGKNYSVAIPVSTEQQIVDNEHNDAVGRTKEIIQLAMIQT